MVKEARIEMIEADKRLIEAKLFYTGVSKAQIRFIKAQRSLLRAKICLEEARKRSASSLGIAYQEKNLEALVRRVERHAAKEQRSLEESRRRLEERREGRRRRAAFLEESRRRFESRFRGES